MMKTNKKQPPVKYLHVQEVFEAFLEQARLVNVDSLRQCQGVEVISTASFCGKSLNVVADGKVESTSDLSECLLPCP